MSKAVVKDNKMATVSINKLMVNMGIPMMSQAVYSIVDNALVNIVLDPNMIYGWLGFAAITVQTSMSVMTYLLNVIFVRIGENVVTAYDCIIRYSSLFYLPPLD